MDVLFKSIDVRELLSSQELEESSPLSAPDLRLLIDRLQIRSVHIKSKVQNYILSHHAHFASLFSLSSDVVSTSEQVAAQLSDLVASDRPIDLEIGRVVGEIGDRRREVGERKEEVELVRAVLEVVDMVEEFRGEIREGRVVEAAEKVSELKAAMGRGICEEEEEERGREPVVYGLLRKEWNDCFDQIQEVIVRFMENAVRFDKDMNAIHVKYQSSVNVNDGVELRRILEAMDVVGIMDYGIAKVADLMIKYVITPVISSSSPTSLSEELKQDSEGHITEVILKIVPSVDPEVKDVDGGTIYSASIQAVKFIYNSLCFQNNEWAQCFGRLTWPRMSELIISNFLSKVVPDDASKLAEFEKIILLTSQFESDLKEMMFISSSNDNDRRLSTFTNNVEVHFASRKKVEILARARNLLLQSDFVLPKDFTTKTTDLKSEKTGENGFNHVVNLLFSSESCVVSGAASQLMELVHQTLKDVCLSSTRVALEFYHAARDALLLYEAIVPVKLERQLDGINQVAVLIHNDCLYLSREILGLAFEYRSDFPSLIKELAVFVDLAPRFQLMAKEILRRQVELVIHNLKEAMDGADGFQNTHQIKQFESAKFSVDQVVFILEKVHIIWEPLLLPSTYRGCMCMVLEAVFLRTTKDILLLDDMAAEETLQLQRLIHLMLESLSSLLESLIALTVKWKSPEGLLSSIDDFIPSLRKLRKLAELLDMPLRSITAAWEGGELVSCGFTSSEVVDFIKAIFTDSPLRKECLWRIQNNDFEKF